ncbi:MAG: OmpA family protein [Candidatus Scalindua sp.]|nr:OmpA family protein [Candidatus Scalindua sp.]
MKKRQFSIVALMMVLLLLAGCFQLKPVGVFDTKKLFKKSSLEKDFFMGKYSSKIDNFIIILDTSSSMGVSYEGRLFKGYSKLLVAKDFIKRMNNIVPEMKIKGAIQTFGDKVTNQTETVYGLVTHSRSALEQSLNAIKVSVEGNSPAGIAIDATAKLLSMVEGRNAVILISDGERLEDNPLMKLRALKERYGDRTCFYSVWVGNKPKGKKVMETLAQEMPCGLFTSVDETSSRREMENFVKKVFLATGGDIESDSDGDGVYDDIDRCPGTPRGVPVDEKGCPEVREKIRIDSDGDGIYDDVDRCPGTPRGVPVDEKGCPEVREKIRIDSDGDGVYDDVDRCPGTPRGVPVDEKGCPEVREKIRIDSDRDGVYDDVDWCPDTPIGVAVDGKGCPEIRRIDADGDGIYDDVDECPDTPVGAEVDERGCPEDLQAGIDTDGDGIYDDRDECPDTPKGAIVDFRGCWVIKGVQFEYKMWDISPQFTTNLDNAIHVLTRNRDLKIKIVGHTDNVGSMEYNIDLSEKRANAIKEYFVENGIDRSRITTTGVGFSQPIATNDTPEGRALNRRAELIPIE